MPGCSAPAGSSTCSTCTRWACCCSRPTPGLELSGSYFGAAEPSITSADASYAVSDVGLTHQETHEWIHPVGAVLTALADAGIMIDFLHEHPADDHAPTTLSPTDTTPGVPHLPALYSIRGHLPR